MRWKGAGMRERRKDCQGGLLLMLPSFFQLLARVRDFGWREREYSVDVCARRSRRGNIVIALFVGVVVVCRRSVYALSSRWDGCVRTVLMT